MSSSMGKVKMSRRRLLAFATVTILLAVLVCVGALVAVDVYYHHKLEPYAGLNVWGYRGPTVGHRKAGERRVLAVGGSTTFGYGIPWRDAYPAILQELLNQRSPQAPVTVVNVGYNNEGAHSYRYTLQDYEYLDYDTVVIYTGYNDLSPNLRVYRHGLEHGMLLRPLGDVVYFMPPYVIEPEEIDAMVAVAVAGIQRAVAGP